MALICFTENGLPLSESLLGLMERNGTESHERQWQVIVHAVGYRVAIEDHAQT